MFKYLVVSIVLVPVLLGLVAASSHDLAASPRTLRLRWFLFAMLWIGLLHLLRYRWQ
jgi:hypothetical protein